MSQVQGFKRQLRDVKQSYARKHHQRSFYAPFARIDFRDQIRRGDVQRHARRKRQHMRRQRARIDRKVLEDDYQGYAYERGKPDQNAASTALR